jgi:hypothetical protein
LTFKKYDTSAQFICSIRDVYIAIALCSSLLHSEIAIYTSRLEQMNWTLDVIERKFVTVQMLGKCQYRKTPPKGLIIWTLLSRQLVVATTNKPNLGHLAPASEVAGGHTIPF